MGGYSFVIFMIGVVFLVLYGLDGGCFKFVLIGVNDFDVMYIVIGIDYEMEYDFVV